MVGFLGWVVVVEGAKEERSNRREIFLIFRDTRLLVIRGVVCIRQGEGRRIIWINQQFSTNISELGKYTRNRRRYMLDNGDSGIVAGIS